MKSPDLWVASWMTSGDVGWTYVDPAWRAFTGQSQEEAQGRGWLEALHPDDRQETERDLRRASERRAAFRTERRLRRADGVWRLALVVGAPRLDENGGFLGHVGSISDIGAGDSLETAPEESEALSRTLLGALADGLFIAQDHRFVYANPTLPAMLGYAHGEFEGLPFEAVIAPDDLPLWTTRYAARVGEGPEPPQHYPLALLKKNGARIELELSARRIRYKGRNAVLGLLRDVTERRKADAALRESEERFRQVVQSLPQLVWTCAPDGLCDWLGPQWLAYTGLPEEPQLGYGWLQQLHPDDRERTVEQWRATTARGENFVIDFRLRRYDGAYRWFHTLAVPLKDEGGRIIKWFGSNTDITEIKDVEDALRESEARFASFMRHLPGLAWIKNPEGRYIFVNEAAEAAFQRSLEDIYDRTDAEIFDVEAARAFRANDARAVASETGVVTIETLRHSDGVLHESIVSKFAMRDAAGALRGIGGVAIDITERRQIEDALEQQSRLIDLSFEPIFVWDWDSGIVTWNRGSEQLYGFSRDEALGQSSQKLLRTRFPISFEDYRAQLLQKGEWAGELEHIAKDGQDICVESRHQLIQIGGRKLVLEANRDISERKRAETALRDASARKDEFLATLAHELRNPLAPISYGVELLKQKAAARAPGADIGLLDMMQRQVLHLVKLVDDLLEISRIDRGKIELRKEPTDLAAVVRVALETSQLQIEKGRHRLVTRLAEEPLRIDGDPMRLSQAVTNLVNNAAKFTPDGGLIEIETQKQGTDAVIRVRDNGRGIPPDALPYIFDLFTQIDHGAGGAGGLGIGLALVRKLVELHGGRIEAFSPGPGKGSEFVVTLPLDPQAVVGPPGKSETKAAAPRHAARVVVIDDDPDVAESLRLVLEGLGAAVRVGHDGARAAELVEEFKPDLVFLDLGMPGIDGFETARRIRASRAGKDLTLVALTGWGQTRDRAKTKEAGFDAHLTKPASVEALESALRAPRPRLEAGA